MIEHLTSQPVVAFQLLGCDAVTRLLNLIGPENPAQAKEQYPESLRAIYGIDEIRNAFYVSKSFESAEKVTTVRLYLGITRKYSIDQEDFNIIRILTYYFRRNRSPT